MMKKRSKYVWGVDYGLRVADDPQASLQLNRAISQDTVYTKFFLTTYSFHILQIRNLKAGELTNDEV